ncbi:MAG: alpha/beta hydrolase [Gemmatimonadaceae bacterium]|nr:alpha/beta hydrolase [Gemmatimonadaceae bacterium]
MPRTLRITAFALALLGVGVIGYGAWKNPERGAMDATARAGVPGHFVTLSRGATHYDVSGPDTGRVVLLVHGFSVPMYIWDSTFSALGAAGYRVIRYDLYGRGWSDRPDAAYDGPMYDAQIDELLDSLHVTQPVNLVGLSFGGFVTAHYVAGHARRVRTLTLVDPAASSSPLPGFLTLPVLGPWIWQVTQIPGKAEGQYSDFLHPEHYPTWADQYRPQMRYNGFGRSLLRSAVTMSHTDFGALFAGVAKTSVPVLLIWGKQDQTVPIALSEVVRTNVPLVDFFPVDSSGHLPHIEQAAIVNAKLQQFITAQPLRALPVP